MVMLVTKRGNRERGTGTGERGTENKKIGSDAHPLQGIKRKIVLGSGADGRLISAVMY